MAYSIPPLLGSSPLARGKLGCCTRSRPWGGSSPLARGKPRHHRQNAHQRGLIPARAGKTQAAGENLRQVKAHPRSRGENAYLALPTVSAEGSSPLARGKHGRRARRDGLAGLIPARAGKTVLARRPTQPTPAHPRSRGENDATNKFADTLRGSSPLARGKPNPTRESHRLIGLIPARAGKTRRRSPTCSSARAHPRSRGENVLGQGLNLSEKGSSPLARGKRINGQVEVIERGAHPRSRGENAAVRDELVTVAGSSPLARGKRRAWLRVSESAGLIPARAGKTPSSGLSPGQRGAHPRSRGENVRLHGCAQEIVGSSPLARGKPRGAY